MAEYKLYPLPRPLGVKALCTAFITECEPDFYFGGESHDFYECVFILRGEAGITAGQDIYCLHAGQMIIHPRMEFHRIWNASEKPLRFLIFTFDSDEFPYQSHPIRAFSESEGADLCSYIEQIRNLCVMNGYRILAPRTDISILPLCLSVRQIECLLMTILERDEPLYTTADTPRSAHNYSEAVVFLQKNLNRRLTVDEIAQASKMSRSALQKMFLHYTGVGVITYYHRMEITRATELLRSGRTVKETAAILGFTDQNYFSRFYTRHTDTPPSHCRSKYE